MSNKIDIWKKYKKINVIGNGIYGKVYKVQNIENGYYYAIKEINKTQNILSNIKILKELKIENNLIKEIIDTKEYLYIIMELCEYNLENYIKKREDLISINEIKEILIQLNKIIKKMNEENIIHRDLKLSNILISVNKINKISFKLCNFNLSKNTNLKLKNNKNILTIAPEIIKEGNINNKNDIWSLGVIIYYLLFKEYPYKGESEILLYNDIISGKELKKSNNNELNDLLNKMICIDLNKRISWNDYFNHSFFKYNNNIIKYPKFEFNCNIHNKIIGGYCTICKMNICEECLNNHLTHNIIDLNKIGMNNEEKIKTDKLIEEIEINMKNMNKIKEDIISFLNKIKLNKDIINDENNNFKKYYIEYLEIIKEKLKIEENIIMIDLNKSFHIIEIEL